MKRTQLQQFLQDLFAPQKIDLCRTVERRYPNGEVATERILEVELSLDRTKPSFTIQAAYFFSYGDLSIPTAHRRDPTALSATNLTALARHELLCIARINEYIRRFTADIADWPGNDAPYGPDNPWPEDLHLHDEKGELVE